MKKYQDGVTLIQTVIAVIMLILLAGFAIFNSNDTILETQVAKAYNEIVEVKKAVIEVELLEDEGMKIFSGERIENLDAYPDLAPYNKVNQEYYYLDFKNKSDVLLDILEVRNVENNYIVNVKDIENVEIFSAKGIKVGNDKIYTEAEIVEKYNDIFGGR